MTKKTPFGAGFDPYSRKRLVLRFYAGKEPAESTLEGLRTAITELALDFGGNT